MNRIIYILNGPNLNLLGTRQPEKYGIDNIKELEDMCSKACLELNFNLLFFQSNFEGELIEKIHQAQIKAAAIIINAAALTHTSIGILDALSTFNKPIIEVHITNIYARESFRHKSFISPVASGVIAGLGTYSYVSAINAVNQLI